MKKLKFDENPFTTLLEVQGLIIEKGLFNPLTMLYEQPTTNKNFRIRKGDSVYYFIDITNICKLNEVQEYALIYQNINYNPTLVYLVSGGYSTLKLKMQETIEVDFNILDKKSIIYNEGEAKGYYTIPINKNKNIILEV